MRIRTHAARELDRIDLKSLSVLQENVRIPITKFVERIGPSATPCGERIKTFKKRVILSYHTLV